MEGTELDEAAFFGAIQRSGARALLIGRQALIALGLPVMTNDYDFWIHIDDAAIFNAAAAPFGLAPNHSPEEARTRGRYVLENDERVDVLVSRTRTTVDGVALAFEDAWSRRVELEVAPGVRAPCLSPSPELIAEVRAIAERVLSREELDAYLRTPMSDEERADILDSIRWFTTRYPTPAARLAYNRRAMKRAKRRGAG